jgi:hypothetical protein
MKAVGGSPMAQARYSPRINLYPDEVLEDSVEKAEHLYCSFIQDTASMCGSTASSCEIVMSVSYFSNV